MTNLQPGNYRLTVEAAGFRRFLQENIVLRIDSTIRTDAHLELGGVTEAVTVSGVNGAIVHGQFFGSSEYEIDGITNTACCFSGFQVIVPNQDSVQEMKVTTGAYDPEFGASAGMVAQELADHSQRLEQWRSQQSGRQKLAAEFWSEAAALGLRHGFTRVATCRASLMQDRNGNQIKIRYAQGRGAYWPNSSGRIVEIEDVRAVLRPSGNYATFTFTYNANAIPHLETVTNHTATGENLLLGYTGAQMVNSPFGTGEQYGLFNVPKRLSSKPRGLGALLRTSKPHPSGEEERPARVLHNPGEGQAISLGLHQTARTAPFRNFMDSKALHAHYTFRIGAVMTGWMK